MTQHFNTEDGIPSEKIPVSALTSGLLRKAYEENQAYHCELSGDMDITGHTLVTRYSVRIVPGKACPCGNNALFCVYSYLTLQYAHCKVCGYTETETYRYSNVTRRLQQTIAYAFPDYATALHERYTQEEHDKAEYRRLARRRR